MPKSMEQRLAHYEALADKFENYEPREEDHRDAKPSADIGHLLGTSGQATQQRYGSRG